MTKWFLAVALILMAFQFGFAQSKESLVGTWKLVSMTTTKEKGEVRDPWGPNLIGVLTYTAAGRVSVVVAASGRKPYSSPSPSDTERAEAARMFLAYAGSYTFTGDEIIHHIEVASDPGLTNTELRRTVKLEGDRLTLRGGFLVDGRMRVPNLELVWERMKPKTTD